jgi:hypothetical protein
VGTCDGAVADDSGDAGAVLVRVIVLCRQELGLSDAQLERLDRLSLDLVRELIRRRAEVEVAQIELAVLLQPDAQDPAKPAEAAAAEAKIRDIARIAAEGDVARMRTIESVKAVLTSEQRAKLAALLDDPVVLARAPGGGGGHPSAPGGGGGRPPGGGVGRPPGGSGGHPPGGGVGRPPGGGGGRPPGGGGGHAQPPAHRFDGRHDFGGHWHPSITVWPWSWSYPYWSGYVYGPAWPPPAYVPPTYWYYCASAGAYYPYVPSCPEGWITVAPGVG